MDIGAEKVRFNGDGKILGVISFGLFCALLLIIVVNVSINTSSGIRAYVAGEGYWAKAQKEAALHLSNYIITEDPEKYDHFESVLRVIEGDRLGREELQKDDFDYNVVYEGFITGKNHPEDIDDMINLLRRFQGISHVNEAIETWAAGDEKIDEFRAFAANIHSVIQNSDSISLAQKTDWMQKLESLDHELTDLEYNFSQAMGNMARLINEIFRWTTITLGLIIIFIGVWITSRFYRSTQNWARILKESQEQLKNILDNSKDFLYKLNLKTRTYEFVSPGVYDMLGYEKQQYIDGGIPFVLSITHPDDLQRMNKEIKNYDELSSSDFLSETQFRLKTKSGEYKWVSNVRSLIHDEQGNATAIVGAVRDISTQKEQERTIKESLKEKEFLLKEIHHRVKNNLAIISSLLELQKDGVSEEVQSMLTSSQARIKSIAKVHEKLYESTTLSDINLNTYIAEITEEIKRAYLSDNRNIDIQMDLAPLTVDINNAIPIGLILNELINNAYKHAFKGLKTGTLRIKLNVNAGQVELSVESDGNKMKKDFNINESDSLGMTLIEVLVQRIDGQLNVEQDDWTRFIISFDLKDNIQS
jgi:PAS domain S-box-containing protein